MTDILTYFAQLFSFDSSHPLLFTQIHFWVFFLIVFAVYTLFCTGRPLTKHRRVARNAYLFAVSLLFYYKTSGLFVLLLVFSTLLGWWLGIRMDSTASQPRRKALMTTGVTINLLILFYFKYAYFFTDIYNATFGTNLTVVNHLALWANNAFGTNHFDAAVILLPVGISFFTFQNISYIVDVYKRKIAHVGNILDFGFYTSFFPQLVAGPILRADQFVPQLYKPFFLGRRQFGIAVFWILNGLTKKLIMSDYLAVNFVDRVFNNPSLFTPFENLSALFIYSLQVYADFSGYTDIAIGVAMLMGFHLPKNFNSPYKATNAGNFWKRWHISLSNWLKDYLYIPLGGNRNATFGTYFCILFIAFVIIMLTKSAAITIIIATITVILTVFSIASKKARLKISTNLNNMNTMLLGGLWHGASWNFMIWGGLNGLGILGYKIWRHCNNWVKPLVIGLIFTGFMVSNYFFPAPILRIACVWTGAIAAGTLIKSIYTAICPKHDVPWLDKVWGITQTFVFITFTRLFFRSGSNLDPAVANETAWNTAKSMVNSIGSTWNVSVIPNILNNYRTVFILFALGMIIHWLPDRWKRWYRMNFALLPVWVIGIIVVVAVFVLYQFVTADLQPFIYFQF